MTVKLVMLKSGEDIIADVQEIKSEEDVIGYYFHHPLIVKPQEQLIKLYEEKINGRNESDQSPVII